MMGDLFDWWFDNHFGKTVLVGAFLLIGLILMASSARMEERREACANLYAMSRTHADTMAVALRCELRDEARTTVYPVVAPVRVGR